MPFLHRFSLFRAVLVLFVITGTFFSAPQSALADPHAVFYTDRAQEQLFFNVLAALNQADYVEPPEGEYSRRQLIDARSAAVYQPTQTPLPEELQGGIAEETDFIIRSTRTELPSTLTRNVTLEGDDLWTAYLVNQFAIEVANRTATSELAKVYCERGLGRAGCDRTANPDSRAKQDRAFVVNPLLHDISTTAPFSILSSGTDADQQIRQDIARGELEPHNPLIAFRPYDSFVAEKRKQNQDDERKSEMTERLLSRIATSSPRVDPFAFHALEFDDNNNARLPEDSSTSDYLAQLSMTMSQPYAVVSTANRGMNDAQRVLGNEIQGGAVADRELVAEIDEDGTYKTVQSKVTTPASSKLAMQQMGAMLVNAAVSNQQFAAPEAINVPGTEPVVDRQGLGQQGQTQGITTENEEGRVEGTMNFALDFYTNIVKPFFDDPKPAGAALSPSTNIISPQREVGTFNMLRALTDDTYRRAEQNQSCGLCVTLDNIINNVSFNDLMCSIFPEFLNCKEERR